MITTSARLSSLFVVTAVVAMLPLTAVGSTATATLANLPLTASSQKPPAPQPKWAKFASGPGTILYLAASVGLPWIRDGDAAQARSFRAFEAIASSVLVCEGLKRLARVPRPDGNGKDSFPSGHATAAFAAATMQSAYHPNEAALWYLGAAAIGQSRITLGRHRPSDVIAGALLGLAMGRLEISAPRGFLITASLGVGGKYDLMLRGRM